MPEGDRHLAPAKLTRTLRVVGLRADGYHLLESEMVTLDLADELVISDGDGLEVADEIDWVGSGRRDKRRPNGVPGDDSNLVMRALRLAARTGRVRLTKRIPPGAGLGGGSADAAAILRWAGVDDLDLALTLGADVPFCLRGGRAMVRGIGGEVEPLPHEEHSFVILTPRLSVSTPAVYRAWDELGGPAGEQGNDLEPAALCVQPQLSRWRSLLAESSGLAPRLAGSGSTYFVECPDDRAAARLATAVRRSVVSEGATALVRACRSMPAEG